MDYLNKLEKIRSAVSSSVSSTVFSTISTVKDVLPGNNVTKEFEVGEHIASGGPALMWKIYSGSKKSTRQSAAVFVLEKRALEARYPDKLDREAILEQCRKAVAQLTRLKHPQVLTVQHPLEESRDCLAFATEPVYASLANVLGRHDNLPSPVPPHIRDYKMFDVEIKYGLLQLCEGFTFLHDSVKLLHRNISPESIILNESGAWKIFGFDFCLPADTNKSSVGGAASAVSTWTFNPQNELHAAASMANEASRPDLDFMAPEYALRGNDADIIQLTPAADLFAVGMVAFALYNTKPLFTNSGSWTNYKKNASELKHGLRESNLQLIPSDLRSTIKLLLNATAELRPTAAQLSQIPYFEDVGVKTLMNLDSQFQWDNLQKSQFYKGLPQIIPRLPHRVAIHRVVPCLAKEFVNPHMVPFVLPSVLAIAEEATQADYVAHILPDLRPVMKVTEPIQVLLIFMQRMEMLLSKTPPSDVKSDVLPMVYRALESDTAQIQELCLSMVPAFAGKGLLDYQATKSLLLPRIKRVCVDTSLLSVRVNGLVCIGKLLTHMDKWLVLDEILPMLQQIPSREPAVIMAIVGIYKMTLSDNKLGMTKEIIATKILPFLFPLSIENGLTVLQYNAVMALIKDLISKVEDEHREKLQQLNSIVDEQRSALKMSMSENMQTKPGELVPSSTLEPSNEMDQLFAGLGLGSYVSKKDTGAIATGLMSNTKSQVQERNLGTSALPDMSSPISGSSGNLSLSQKQKMLSDSENLQRIATQPKLTPLSSGGPRSSINSQTALKGGIPEVKDLTSSLMSANLNQMKHSQSHTGGGFNAKGNTNSFNQGWSNMSNTSVLGNNNSNVGGFNSIASYGIGSMQPQPLSSMSTSNPQKQPSPDLSAFDSLLPSTNKSIKSQPMNSMAQHKAPGTSNINSSGFTNLGSVSFPPPPSMQRPSNSQANGTSKMTPSLLHPTNMSSQSSIMKPTVKSLTSNDINDLLS